MSVVHFCCGIYTFVDVAKTEDALSKFAEIIDNAIHNAYVNKNQKFKNTLDNLQSQVGRSIDKLLDLRD
jgi:hypothetical protein